MNVGNWVNQIWSGKEKQGDASCIDWGTVQVCQKGIKMPFTQLAAVMISILTALFPRKRQFSAYGFLDLAIITSAKIGLMLIKAYLSEVFLCKPSKEKPLVISTCTHTMRYFSSQSEPLYPATQAPAPLRTGQGCARAPTAAGAAHGLTRGMTEVRGKICKHL